MSTEGDPASPQPSARGALGAPLPVLRGDRVLLRQPVPEDLAARLEVPADPELNRMYGGSGDPEPVSAEKMRAMLAGFAEQDLSTVRRFLVAALVWPDGRPIDSPDGRYVGHVRLNFLSWRDRNARMAMGIYDRRFWSRGFGTEALRLLLRYAFDDLALHRVDLRVIAYNVRAMRCYEKCGFVREGVERECALVDGVWHDDVMMGILEDEYRAQPWAGRR
ncbi:MAG TPA: GNAT family protein [Chloroflexota bacterium]|jgi:RimJ/RimL family protein N-acetyltransferase